MFKLTDYTVLSVNQSLPQNLIEKSKQALQKMDIYEEWLKTKGKGMKVGIVDTGIDTDHQDLKAAIKATYNPFDNTTNVEDQQGHGTHCAGVVAANGVLTGIAPDAGLYIAKALNDNGEGTEQSLINAIQWCIDQDVDVISMSLGSQEGSEALHDVIKKAAAKNIIMVCASGNDGNETPGQVSIDYPAKYEETIAVGAVDLSSNIANFSSIGNVDVVAYGVQVLSTYMNNSYALLSGTSMATPYIAGAICLIQANAKNKLNRRLTLEEVRIVLSLETNDLGIQGKDQTFGFGEFTF